MKDVINGTMKNTTKPKPKPKPKSKSKRRNLFTKNGKPRRIKCYMTKRNPTIDFITVVYTHASKAGWSIGTVLFRNMSKNPCHPQGVGLWGEARQGSFKPGVAELSFLNCL